MRLLIFIFTVSIAMACGSPANNAAHNIPNANGGNKGSTSTTPAQTYTYELVKTYPHDGTAFTQGLVIHNGALYEGTGGKESRGDDFASSVRKVDLETGKVLKKYNLSPDYFGEGITVFGDKIFQLTWQDRTAFTYDLNDFKMLKEFRYSGDGWGLTNNDTDLIMSDGTHVIKFIDPETFATKRTIVVNDETGKPLMKLNELEFIKGEIWANVWQTDWIVRIDPANGKLLGRIDLSKLADAETRNAPDEDVLNGIAWDAANDRIFVTGKFWKHLYEIKIKEQ